MRTEGLIRRLAIAGATAAAVVAVDLVTKRIAATTFRSDPVEVIGSFLTFSYTENSGASFGLFRGGGSVIGLAAFVAVGIVVGALLERRSTTEVIAFGLIAGGAVGNLVDRIARGPGLLDGAVIDWIRLPDFPLFNIADSSLTVGVAILLLLAWRHR